ncbi:S-adenosyl-L-methionine-dependent methyltransferase [Apodospora peruviana]|uniref:S-adenosyl-L-methionine-dependent methyltransferase n=1 Tax=Apodospora peruviana TaxID=516989 RepID=A0AAE0HY85_9PEZI|nr:S-adenosyl-L-methionine-dependent methyltransferase [Apodospora peruviana]
MPADTAFNTGARKTDTSFWRRYVASRPSPPDSFFDFIHAYHERHSADGRTVLAHDVGTGPGNIAARLLSRYDRVIGSDVNEAALDAAPALLPPDQLARLGFVHAGAEDLASQPPEAIGGGLGTVDLVVVSECMPLLDAPKAMASFAALLRPGGTLAAYFYGRPLFASSDSRLDAACDAAYERVATRVSQLLWPIKDTPAYPFYKRGSEALASYLDSVAVPAGEWAAIERHKWNCDRPLIFAAAEGYDFPIEPGEDRRGPGESTFDRVDRQFWSEEWDFDHAKTFVESIFPKYQTRLGTHAAEIDRLFAELERAMGGRGIKRKVTFPVVLILASRK